MDIIHSTQGWLGMFYTWFYAWIYLIHPFCNTVIPGNTVIPWVVEWFKWFNRPFGFVLFENHFFPSVIFWPRPLTLEFVWSAFRPMNLGSASEAFLFGYFYGICIWFSICLIQKSDFSPKYLLQISCLWQLFFTWFLDFFTKFPLRFTFTFPYVTIILFFVREVLSHSIPSWS